MKKQYVVFGLGNFGRSVALTLEQLGCDVVAVDSSLEKVQEIADLVSYAIRADVSDPDSLKMLGTRNLDGAVVALSDNLEASIMATIVSKEMGIPYILAKAKNELHETVLTKVGADIVVYPERDMGARVAKNLMSSAFTDWIELSTDYSLMEKQIPESWVGKSIVDLKIRERYHVNVVGLLENGEMDVDFDPRMPLSEKMVVALVGANKQLEKFR
ncbi:potassium channel family protein [Hespellia stercorisuis]|uniref:Trk system potassium uptake protein TrkA n=1 Tax=Hespellia stercorisuis DSM 15480 TaxID=1121950 RepID=A0A1M6NFX0_9FIRM|nr:TrkA family potassium uptake protein [Hespellia stercorisuis]SHJ94625.1 trk system potassium uptake protein TrkA [Hespellia stercorisuis DSM 15480]